MIVYKIMDVYEWLMDSFSKKIYLSFKPLMNFYFYFVISSIVLLLSFEVICNIVLILQFSFI